jgi:hypothetical protein
MKNLPLKWITIKYQENMFDVKLSDHVINEIRTVDSEIRTVDSEINILNIIDKHTHYAIQHLAEENHHAV